MSTWGIYPVDSIAVKKRRDFWTWTLRGSPTHRALLGEDAPEGCELGLTPRRALKASQSLDRKFGRTAGYAICAVRLSDLVDHGGEIVEYRVYASQPVRFR